MKPLAPRRVALSLAVLPLDVARNVHEEGDGKQEGLNDVGPVLRRGVGLSLWIRIVGQRCRASVELHGF